MRHALDKNSDYLVTKFSFGEINPWQKKCRMGHRSEDGAIGRAGEKKGRDEFLIMAQSFAHDQNRKWSLNSWVGGSIASDRSTPSTWSQGPFHDHSTVVRVSGPRERFSEKTVNFLLNSGWPNPTRDLRRSPWYDTLRTARWLGIIRPL